MGIFYIYIIKIHSFIAIFVVEYIKFQQFNQQIKDKGGVTVSFNMKHSVTGVFMKNLFKKKTDDEESSVSSSKEKRTERRKEVAKEKRNHLISKIIWITLLCAAICALVIFTGTKIYKYVNKTTANSDFSAQLNDDGTIKDVNVTKKVTLCDDYKTIPVTKKDITLSDTDMQSDIQKQLDSHKTLDKTTTAAIKKDDIVNIDYVGKIDGKEFDGGSAEGYDLTIGSGSFIEGFEDQLIGHKAGEKVTVNVTFPDSYSETSLAGKKAAFDVTINGLEVAPEFNDEFVKTNLSEYADTADGYRQYLKDDYAKTKTDEAVEKYLTEKCKISGYPRKYTKQLRSLQKYKDEQTYRYMNTMYSQYYGYTPYQSFSDYTQKTDDEYEKSLVTSSKEQAAKDMIYQKICSENNIKVTSDDYSKYQTDTLKTSADEVKNMIEQEGKGYCAQQMMKIKALELIEKTAVIK